MVGAHGRAHFSGRERLANRTERRVATDVRTTEGFSRAAVEALSAARNEPDWLREWRLAAWATYEATPMPTRQDEDWRRTDLRALKLDQFAPVLAPPAAPVVEEALGPYLAPDTDTGGLLVLQDGALVARELRAALDAGVVLTTLERAVREHPGLVRRYLGSVAPASAGKFPALNAAFWDGGAFVYVPRNVAVALPLAVLTWQQTPGAALFPRTLVILEQGASLTLVAEVRSLDQDAPALSSSVAELVVGDNAELRYAALQRWGRHMWHFGFERATLGRDARLHWGIGALGGRLSKSYIQAVLAAPGASLRTVGAVLADGTQHFDHQTLQHHVAPHTASDLGFRAVVTDSARSVFSGLIHVEKQAQQTDAYLQNRNLLLSEKAKADSIPRLEIEANDVRCTHGATVAPVDPEQVFYLRTRGLTHDEAERMIVAGFFEPLLDTVPVEGLRERLRAALAEKMERSHG
jgi:Fe-S cluster assembly protein SufD